MADPFAPPQRDQLDELMDSRTNIATGAAAQDPLDEMMDGYVSARTTQMNAATTRALGVNPDKYASQRKVAQYLGYPTAAVEALPVQTEQEAKLKQIKQDTAQSPVLQRRFTDEDFARLAHDDTASLATVAGWFTDTAKYVVSAPGARNTLAGDVGAGVQRANRGAAGVFQGAAELPAPLLDFMEATTPQEAAGWRGAVGGNPLRRLAEGFAGIGAQNERTAREMSPPQAGTFAGGVSSGVQSFTQNMLALPMAFLPGGQGAALTMMAGGAGGQAYQDAREQGMGTAQAIPFAASQAAIEYATEKLPLARLIGDVKVTTPFLQTLARQAALEIPGEQIATVLQDLNEWAVLPANKDKPFSEYLAERPNAAAQTLIATIVGTGGSVTLTQALASVAGPDAQERASQQKAADDAQRVTQLFAAAAESKLRERSPETFASVVQDMAESTGGAPAEVRFDARTLADTLQQSGMDEAAIARLLPSLAPQMQEALATGGEVTMPMGEFTGIVGTELEQVLLQNARIGTNELSQLESQAASAEADQLLVERAQRATESVVEESAARAGAESVQATVLDQLNTANRFTPDVNAAYATLVRDFYATTAGRLGVTPDELYTRFPLRVQAESPSTRNEVLSSEEPRTFEQSSGTPVAKTTYTDPTGAAFDVAVSKQVFGANQSTPNAVLVELRDPATGERRGFVDFSVRDDGVLTSENTKVAPAFQKRGFAAAMYRAARDAGFDIAPGRVQTDQGLAMVSSLQRQGIVNREADGPRFRAGDLELAQSSGVALQPGFQSIELGDTTVSVSVKEDTVEVSMVKTPEGKRGQGSARAAMQQVLQAADAQGLTAFLTPEAMDSSTSKAKLETFYKSLGFKPNKGRSKDFRSTSAMVREPQGTLQQGPRGTFNPNSLTISLLQKADLSTFLHETGHFFLEVLADVSSQPDAPAGMVKDMAAVLEWFGVADLDTWNGMTLEQQRKYHERFAESFEQYLLEGKAPSTELQPLFQRFRAWLTNVYQSLNVFMAGRNLQLSDEVRSVFNRLLATDEQIRQAESLRSFAPMFDSAEQAGMTPQEWANYQMQGQKATATALDEMTARSMKDMRWLTNARSRALKALQKETAEKRKAVEKEVAAEVAQEPVYRAQRWLRKGEMTTPEGEEIKSEKGFRLNTAALAEMYPDSMLGRPDLDRLKGMTAGNGLHPDMVAEMFGYDSGDAMVRAILDAEPQASVIEGKTDQRMLERFGDLATEAGVQRAADEAVHNEARGRFVATELRALQKANSATERTPAGGNVNVMVRAAKTAAGQLIARRKVRELKVGQHTANETRAARAAEKALRTGKTQEAIVAKRDELLSHYAARETYRALDEVDKALVYLGKFGKDATRKKMPPEYLDQIDKLLERVDLRRGTTLASIDKRAKLNDWIKSQQDMGIEVELPAYVLEDAQLTSYKDLPLESFRGLVETVKQIEHLGRLKNKLLTAKDEREFTDIKDSIVKSILDNAGNRTANTRTPTTNLGRALQGIKQFGAAHIKAATWARILDGGKDGGPVWEFFVRSANERGDQETTMRAKATRELSEIMAPLLAAGKLGGKGVFFPSVNRSLNRESVLAIALNTGNEGNLQRLLGGEGWTLDQLQPVLATLTAPEWAAVQRVWDYFDSYRPLIGAKERRVFGKEPDWVEPGSAVTERLAGGALPAAQGLKGGYYPIKYDPAASVRAEEHADAEGAKRQLQGAYGAATTKRSFTKARVEEVSGRPLLYTLSGVYSGVNDVIHDLAWHEWLIDTNRLLRSQSIDTAMRSKYGPEVVRQFKSWRDAIAEGESGAQEAIDMALGKLRQSVSVAGLGFNVMSALMQPLGITQSITRVGAGWIGKGVMQYVAAPIDAAREVNGKSSFMANRSRTRFRELNELRNKVQGQSTFKRVVDENAYFLMMRLQQTVDVPTWLGAYEKAVADGQDEARAVSLADQAVIDSQGGGQTKDLAAIERGGPAQKLFTVFYSFMNTALNLGVASKMTPKSRAKFAVDMLMLYAVPAVLGSFLKDALTPGGGDEEDPEKLAKKLVGEQLSFLLGLVVLGREFGSAAQQMTGGVDYTRDYSGPAGVRAIADIYQFTKQAGQGEFDDAFRKSAINLAGDFLGLPSAQINRSITGVKALAEGKTSNPAAAVLGFQEK